MNITGHTRLLGFFADPASHSKSPVMYNSAFEYLNLDMVYLAFRTEKKDIGRAVEAMRTLNMAGANISMPNKAAVMEYLDEISSEAKLAGAVNTVVNQDGRLTGYNTDIYGAMKALKVMGAEPEGKNIVLLGAGGAGSAVMAGLAFEKAGRLSVFVREKSMDKHSEYCNRILTETGLDIQLLPIEDERLLAERICGSQILINATNVGMGSLVRESLIKDSSCLHSQLYVMDAIYSPSETELLKQSKRAGVKGFCNGMNMLLYQGEKAFKLYTGLDMPLDVVRTAWEQS